MYRNILLPITVVTLLLTGWAIRATGWLHAHQVNGTSAPKQIQKTNQHAAANQAALRYQQCQPRHWRYLMLQH